MQNTRKDYKASLDTTFSKLGGPDLEASKKSRDCFKAQTAREWAATLASLGTQLKERFSICRASSFVSLSRTSAFQREDTCCNCNKEKLYWF